MKNRLLDKTLLVLFIVYVAVLLRITVFRPWISLEQLFDGSINFSFMVGYAPLVRSHSWERIIYLFVGNIIWFIPLGMYFRRYTNMKWLSIVALGFGLSLFIEVMQYVLGTGVSELDDLVLNTLGTALGVWMMRKLAGGKRL